MIDSSKHRKVPSRWHKRSSAPARWAAVATLALAAGFTTAAFAASTTVTIHSASNSKLGEQVLVSSRGHTLYALSPETASHLLCKSAECVKFWPPVTVSSRKTKLKDGPGVHGHLAILRRSNGMLQVTLRGLPLYQYSGDHAKGEANGQGIKSFGGTWNAVTGAAAATTTPTEPAEEKKEEAPYYPPGY